MGAAGAALTLLPVAAGAAAIPRRWDTLRARYEEANEEADRYNDGPYNRAWKRFEAILGERPPASYTIPTKRGPEIEVKITRTGSYPSFPQWDRAREMQRVFNDWYDRWINLEKEAWWAIPTEKMDALWSVADQARETLMEEPAPDAAALVYKVHLALANEEFWANERAAIERDAKRLMEI
jgi:hypothetical protein